MFLTPPLPACLPPFVIRLINSSVKFIDLLNKRIFGHVVDTLGLAQLFIVVVAKATVNHFEQNLLKITDELQALVRDTDLFEVLKGALSCQTTENLVFLFD